MLTSQQIQLRHKKFDFSWAQYVQRLRKLQKYQFDKYQILQKLGSGSFATVYRGIILETKKQVAIKVISKRDVQAEKNDKVKTIKKRMVETESKIMMKFNHQNILKCYQCFQSFDFKFMILQFCNSGSLLDQIQTKKKISQEQAILILKQIINGIAECHRIKIIHRDLKPDNILIHNGVYKIADFGFSKHLQIQDQNQILKNTVLGTRTTMAPQVKNKKPYGLKADIWSIGVIFFHMIFGQCPYASNKDAQTITNTIHQKLQTQVQYNKVRPSQKVKKFLKQVLSIDVEKRLGWRQLVNHEIFQKDIQQKLRNSFNRDFDLQSIGDDILKIQKQFIIKGDAQTQMERFGDLTNEDQKPINQKDFKIKNLEQKQKISNMKKQQIEEQVPFIKKTASQEIKVKEKKEKIQEYYKSMYDINEYQIRLANDQQKQLFEWAKRTHIQCQKTEVILKHIIQPIEKNKLFNIKSRDCIEFIYLLVTRCYNNMSPINFQYENNKSNILKQLKEGVGKLYDRVIHKWQFYQNMLTIKQNQKVQIAADWAKRNILNRIVPKIIKYNEKEKFMTGIECMREFRNWVQYYQQTPSMKKQQTFEQKNKKQQQQALKDYTKEEQIQYTILYYKQNIQKLLNKKQVVSLQQCKSVKYYMESYEEICGIKQEDLKKKPFKKYLEEDVMLKLFKNQKKKIIHD